MSADNPDKKYCFSFVCEPGELEIKSLLLAYSLRETYNRQPRIFVLIPSHQQDKISGITYSLYNSLSVEICSFENPITQGKSKLDRFEPMSNKFFGLKQIDFQGTIIFLDSDIVSLKALPQEALGIKLAVKPADYSLKAQWQIIYGIAGIPFPQSIVMCTVDSCEGPPYYNTGVIFLNSIFRNNLCSEWENYFRLFSEKPVIDKNLYNSYHCDQLAFALATQKLRINVEELTELFNFPVRSRNFLPDNTFFAHYHDCFTIARSKNLMNIFSDFTKTHPEVLKLFSISREWKLLANKNFMILNLLEFLRESKKKAYRYIIRMK